MLTTRPAKPEAGSANTSSSTTIPARTPACRHKRRIRYTSTDRWNSWRHNARRKQAVEMPVYGKPGIRYNRFPPLPQTLKINETDSHISTATTTN
jgi:hypothetical protein